MARDDLETLINRGNQQAQSGQWATSIETYSKVIALDPSLATIIYNRGVSYATLQRLPEALADYERAIALGVQAPYAIYNRAGILLALERYDEALKGYDEAIRLDPNFPGSHFNRGAILLKLGDKPGAADCFERVLRLQPDNVAAFNNLGFCLDSMGWHQDALKAYDAALKYNPNMGDVHINRATLLANMGREAEAAAGYDTGLKLSPDAPFARGMRLMSKMQICDWKEYESDIKALENGLERSQKVTPPFPALAFIDSPGLQLKAAQIWTRDNYPNDPALGKLPASAPRDRIRVGYFSSDLHGFHPVASAIVGIIEAHDRAKFEIYAFSYSPNFSDAMRKRLESAFDKFVDVLQLSDREIAATARRLEIDIAVDVSGYTAGARPRIFSLRAAPVQMLLYPGTMGDEAHDYIIADPVVIPPEARAFYSEKVIYLPSHLPSDPQRTIANRTPSRAELGLPEQGFVFCSFNNRYKITPETFAVWMRILARVKDSVLWLSGANPVVIENLRAEAVRHGVAPERLIFADRMEAHADHLARHAAAGLFLDTLPYNAQTTASDALFAGLPVLTVAGETFSGRVAASLLTALDLPELIVPTREAYEALAIELATTPSRLQSLREKLARNRLTSPLFDIVGYTRNLETALTIAAARQRDGLLPDHIVV